jgi:hypothetical protein
MDFMDFWIAAKLADLEVLDDLVDFSSLSPGMTLAAQAVAGCTFLPHL